MKKISKITLTLLIILLSLNSFAQKVETETSPINLHLEKYEFKTSFDQNTHIFGTITTPYLYANNLKMNPLISPLTIIPIDFYNSDKNLIFIIGIKFNIFNNTNYK